MSHATSILDALKMKFPKAKLYYPEYSDPTNMADVNTVRSNFYSTLG